MIERRTVIGIAIAFCIVILGIFTISDKQEQREYAKWAQEMNTVLNESRAADAEIAELSRQKEEWEGEKKKKEEKAREEEVKETTVAGSEKAAVRYTAATTLNVRAEKSTSSRILGTVDKGDSLPDGVQDGDWIRFTYKGKEGFVYATYVIEE
jgi:uncharacterized protein YgiM (DUF1202 family)